MIVANHSTPTQGSAHGIHSYHQMDIMLTITMHNVDIVYIPGIIHCKYYDIMLVWYTCYGNELWGGGRGEGEEREGDGMGGDREGEGRGGEGRGGEGRGGEGRGGEGRGEGGRGEGRGGEGSGEGIREMVGKGEGEEGRQVEVGRGVHDVGWWIVIAIHSSVVRVLTAQAWVQSPLQW